MSLVETALRDASVPGDARDSRGLMALDRARDILERATLVDRDGLDAIWAAMLSLEDAADLVARTRHLDWRFPVRGRENVALVERYASGALEWIATRIRDEVLINHPWCVVPSLLAIGDPEALRMLLKVSGVVADAGDMKFWQWTPQQGQDPEVYRAAATDLAYEWTRAHPDAAYPVLAHAARENERARAVLRKLADASPRAVQARLAALGEPALAQELGLASGLTPDAILATLDAACRGEGGGWPWFVCGVDGRTEYFDLRLVVIRRSDDDAYAIVLERLQGCDPDSFMLQRFAYGPHAANGSDFDHSASYESDFTLESPDGNEDGPVFGGMVANGPAGELRLDESLFARLDLKPGFACEAGGWAARTLALRAYLADHPDAYFPAPEAARDAAGMPDGELFLVSRAFRHVDGAAREGAEAMPWNVWPSESETYRSLADAIVSGDASRFVPGDSNLHWSLHAREADDFEMPWRKHRVPTSGEHGFLGAAMSETNAPLDDRGLLPLAEARAIVAASPRLARGDGRTVESAAHDGEGDEPSVRWVWDLDRTWAALLSLADAAEAAKALATMELVDPPRDAADNRALVERYGDAAASIVLARATPEGVVAASSPFLRATVLAIGSRAGFRLVWDLRGWLEPGVDTSADAQVTSLFVAWVSAHPALGYVELARLADTGDANALGFLGPWVAPQPRKVFGWMRDGLGDEAARRVFAKLGISVELSTSHVLACLDSHAGGRSGGDDGWPLFRTGAGPSRELHGLRLIAARQPDGDDWVIVFERCEGYGPSSKIARYVISETIPGGRRPDLDHPLWDSLHDAVSTAAPLDGDAALVEEPDYWTPVDNAPAQIARMRAVLRDGPARVWPDVGETLSRIGFGGVAPLVVATAFEHTAGTKADEALPSALASYRSLADAILARNGARFAPGESNVDPALHITPAMEPEVDASEDESES
jgi:hypothetical protein